MRLSLAAYLGPRLLGNGFGMRARRLVHMRARDGTKQEEKRVNFVMRDYRRERARWFGPGGRAVPRVINLLAKPAVSSCKLAPLFFFLRPLPALAKAGRLKRAAAAAPCALNVWFCVIYLGWIPRNNVTPAPLDLRGG